MKRRLSIITTLLMLCAMGAQAQDYVQFPTSGTTMVDLSDKEVGYTLYLYDNGGPQGNYSNGCDGWVLLKAPADCFLYVDGLVDTEECCDYISIYNGTSSDQLIVSHRGTTTVSVRSDGDMLLYFHTDGSVVRSGLDLTVVVSQEVVKGDFVYADRGRTILLNYIGNDSEVQIPSSVEKMGNNVFAGNPNLTKVVFGSNITKISSRTFQNCANLEAVDMSKATSLTTIDSYAFYNCDALTSVTIPENVTSIGSYAFYDCANLATVDMSKATSLTTIGSYAFRNCAALTKITIPENVTSIGSYAFYNCDALAKITIPENVTSISSYAFYDCANLATVDMSKATSLTTIGSSAFYNCDALTKITIPENVTSIGSYSFYGCGNLATVDMSNVKSLTKINDYVFYNCDALTKITIPENVTTIGNDAFCDCDGLKEITIPEKVTSIGDYAFQSCDNLAKVDFSNAKSLTTIGQYAFNKCGKIKQITIPEKVTTIKYQAFNECENIATVDFSNAKALTEISSFAFANIKNLKTVDLSNAENLTEISSYAFNSCVNLEKVDLSGAKKLTSANATAFGNCPKLKSFGSSSDGVLYSPDGKKLLCYPNMKPDTAFTIPSTVTTIAEFAFYFCENLKKVTIPSSVTSIGKLAFYGCENLAKIDFSKAENLTYIGERAFNWCPKLTTIDLSATSITSIVDNAFYYYYDGEGNDDLTEITLPETVTSIGYQAFCDCDNLKKVNLKNAKNLTTIGEQAFYSCDKLEEINLEKATSLKTIGSNAFEACIALKEITFPESIVSIGYAAFNYCHQLGKVDFSKAKNLQTIYGYAFHEICATEIDLSKATSLAYIYDEAFGTNSKLTNVTVPESIVHMESNVFDGSYNVKFNESEGALYVGNKNNPYVALFRAASEDITECRISNRTKLIVEYAFSVCSNLTSIKIPSSVTVIDNYAFNGCEGLEKVSLPDNISSIGIRAFSNCYSLASVDVPSSVESIGDEAFTNVRNINYTGKLGSATSTWGALMRNGKYNEGGYVNGDFVFYDKECTYLIAYTGNDASIVLPETTQTIGQYVFRGCSSLKSVTIPDGVERIYNGAFMGCRGLKSVTIGSGLASIESDVFAGCPIETLTFNSLHIGNAFTGITTLKTVNVGNKVTYITDYAFQNCSNLQNLNLSNAKSLTSIGSYTFEATGLTEITIPETITFISNYTFRNCSKLEKVDLSKAKNLTSLYYHLFYNCTNLKEVNIGSGLTSIYSSAFENCNNIETLTYNTDAIGTLFSGKTSLKTLNVGDDVKSILNGAFTNCSNLAEIRIGKGVTEVGIDAFSGCNNITSVVTESNADFSNSEVYFTKDGIRYKMLTKNTVEVVANNYSGNIAIPATVTAGNTFKVTKIGDRAFENCEELTSLIIPETVTRIDQRAFAGCTNLTEIKLGKGLKGNFKIGDKAFAGCNNIESVVIESDDLSLWGAELCFIKDGIRYNVVYQKAVVVAPYNYSGNVVIPATVEAGVTYKVIGIGDGAFKDCSSLASIDLSKATNLENIGWQAFSNCDGLTEITISESVTGIDDYAFSGCDNLETVDLSKAENLVNIYNYAFYNCYNLQTIDLIKTKKLEYIGEGAFEDCSSLSSFIIPASVTELGDYAFSGCSSISPILCEAESEPDGWYYNWNYPDYHQVIWHYNNIVVNVEANDSELGTVSGSGTYTYGDEVTISATPADGVNFRGWSDGNTNSSFTFFPTENVNITANFFIPIECVMGDNIVSATGREKYNCVFTPSISGQYTVYSVINVDTYGYLYDADRVLLTSDDDSGSDRNFQFSYNLTAGETYILGVGFYSSNVGDISFVIAGPIEIIANAENGTVDGAGVYYPGNYVGLHAVADPHYQFVKWSDGETSEWRYFYAYENATFTAEFEPENYVITASASSGFGTVEGTGTYVYNSDVTLTVVPNEGYEFVEWSDGNPDNPRKFKAEQTKEYYAVVVSKTFNVEASGNHVSSVDIWGDCYYGNTIELKAWPEPNYHFKEWRNSKGEVLSTANPFNYTVTEDAKFTAVVEGVDCTIDATMEHGTVEGTGTYKYGTTATLKAVPEPGYKFVYWENTSTSATRSFKVETTVANYTAYTMPIEYSVVVSSSDNTKGTVSSDAGSKIYYGNVVNVEATPSGSNKFVRWSDGTTTASRSITVQRDWNLTAVFSEETLYTVTATAGPNGAVTGSARYAAGEKATLTAIANVGYHFVKWSDGSTDASHVITVSGDKSLSAEFAVNTYTVSVTAGANGTATGGGSFEFGAPATITATPATGYHFAGWSDGSAVANRTFNVSADLDLKAEFAINTYTVKASAKNGSVEGAGTYNHGAEATLTATASTGYHFAQWSDGNSVNPRKLTVTSDVDLKAEFDVNSYEITVAAANGTVTGAGTYNYGSVATLSATAADGYHFTKWADGVLSSSRSVIVTEDKKFTAEFEVDAYNVSAYAQNGSVEGAGYYNHGASATLTAKADEGYHFIQWSDGVKDKTRTETVLSSMSFEAEFEVNTFNITAAEAANGVVSGAGTYNYGAVATLTAVANEGYHFTQWSDGLTSATRRLSVVEDAEFSASFEINTYEVKLSAENGTVSGAGTFEHGEEATISAKAAEHYHFVKWSDGNTQNPRTITVTKNRKLSALFEADLYTITVAAENGTVYGASSSFEFGAVATLTASPDLGYHFEKWSDGNTDNPRSVTIDATVLSNLDKPFTAIFEKNPSYVGIEDAEAAADEVNIYAHGNTIVVENAAADIFVYDAMGRMIVRETAAADRTEIQVEGTGVYVVKTGSTSKRVMIK